MCSSDIFLGLVAIIFPPLAVWVRRGICSADSLINILLCVLGYLPGLLHAWYIIIKYPEPDFEYTSLSQDTENGAGRVTYVVVHQPQPRVHSAAPKFTDMNYGSTSNNGSSSQAIAASPATRPALAAAAPAAASSSSAAASSSRAPDNNAGEGSSEAPPPSYAQAVAGDNKIQTQD